VLQKKSNKLAEKNDILSKDRDTLFQTVNDLKKDVSNLEYKIKDQELASNLATGNWEARLTNQQQELKDKNSLMAELQQKYQEMTSAYQ
jgi:hypothetical protein